MSRSAARGALRAWIAGGAPPRPSATIPGQALVDAAAAEGLAPLLAAAAESDGWTEAPLALLRAHQRRALHTAVQQLDTAAEAIERLRRAGLRALPLKGAALAEDLYHSPAERPMCDVDLLALDDFAGAWRVLEEAGLSTIDRGDHAVALRAPSGVVVELHQSATSCPGLFTIDVEALWAQRRAGAGQVKERPAREHLLLLVALHAVFQHGLDLRLVQYLDLRRLLAGPLDAAGVLAAAGAAGARPVLGAALLAAQAVAGATLPEPLRPALGALPARDRRRVEAWCAAVAAGTLVPPTARLRWMAARGRRAALLRGTLRGSAESAALPRAFTLLRRWGLPTLRSWLPPRRPAA
jgi:hypothetical protein